MGHGVGQDLETARLLASAGRLGHQTAQRASESSLGGMLAAHESSPLPNVQEPLAPHEPRQRSAARGFPPGRWPGRLESASNSPQLPWQEVRGVASGMPPRTSLPLRAAGVSSAPCISAPPIPTGAAIPGISFKQTRRGGEWCHAMGGCPLRRVDPPMRLLREPGHDTTRAPPALKQQKKGQTRVSWQRQGHAVHVGHKSTRIVNSTVARPQFTPSWDFPCCIGAAGRDVALDRRGNPPRLPVVPASYAALVPDPGFACSVKSPTLRYVHYICVPAVRVDGRLGGHIVPTARVTRIRPRSGAQPRAGLCPGLRLLH